MSLKLGGTVNCYTKVENRPVQSLCKFQLSEWGPEIWFDCGRAHPFLRRGPYHSARPSSRAPQQWLQTPDGHYLHGVLWKKDQCLRPFPEDSDVIGLGVGFRNGIFFSPCTQGIWTFLGQGSSLRYSNNPSHSNDNTGYISHWATTKRPRHGIFFFFKKKAPLSDFNRLPKQRTTDL